MPKTGPIRERALVAAFRERLRDGKNGARNAALFTLGVNTAFRISDLLSLRVSDARAPDGRIKGEIRIAEGKTGKFRSVPVNDSARDELRAYLRTRPAAFAAEPLFPVAGSRAKALDRRVVWQKFKETARALKLSGIGTHTMRKTFGYFVYMDSGKDLALVQKALNHASPAVTLRYIGVDDERVDSAVRAINL